MRAWTKYSVVETGTAFVPPDHFAQMGGYAVGPEYRSREEFFAAHLWSSERNRAYHEYLSTRLAADDDVLSIASGRAANELLLQQTIGCKIVCSDQESPPCRAATAALFPEFEFRCIDVLADEPEAGSFDAVMALCLIYTFDDEQLSRFFAYVTRTLRPGGRLLLDFASTADNAVSRMFHDVYLPAESAVVAGLLTLKHRRRFTVSHYSHGFRRTTAEIEAAAGRHGLTMRDYWEGAFTTDFQRSVILQRVLARANGRGGLLHSFGKLMPYVRMATFVKSQAVTLR